MEIVAIYAETLRNFSHQVLGETHVTMQLVENYASLCVSPF